MLYPTVSRLLFTSIFLRTPKETFTLKFDNASFYNQKMIRICVKINFESFTEERRAYSHIIATDIDII